VRRRQLRPQMSNLFLLPIRRPGSLPS